MCMPLRSWTVGPCGVMPLRSLTKSPSGIMPLRSWTVARCPSPLRQRWRSAVARVGRERRSAGALRTLRSAPARRLARPRPCEGGTPTQPGGLTPRFLAPLPPRLPRARRRGRRLGDPPPLETPLLIPPVLDPPLVSRRLCVLRPLRPAGIVVVDAQLPLPVPHGLALVGWRRPSSSVVVRVPHGLAVLSISQLLRRTTRSSVVVHAQLCLPAPQALARRRPIPQGCPATPPLRYLAGARFQASSHRLRRNRRAP